MQEIKCEMCGSNDIVKSEGLYVCQHCGTKYTVEEAKKLMVVRIDDSEQLNKYEKLAEAAYEHKNYKEAYTLYLKVLEIRPVDWLSNFRKGMCQAWQASLADMKINEVQQGIDIGMTQLMEADHIEDQYKAGGRLMMAVEVFIWIQALLNIVTEHANEFANKIVDAANEFYYRIGLILELIKLNTIILDEWTLKRVSNRDEAFSLLFSIINCGLAQEYKINTSFKIVTGSEWNSFWQMYDDIITTVWCPLRVKSNSDAIIAYLNDLSNNMIQCRKEWEIEEEEERRNAYFKNHPEERKKYEEQQEELKTITKESESIQIQRAKALEYWNEIQRMQMEHEKEADTINREINKQKYKIFGKDKAAKEIAKNEALLRKKLQKINQLRDAQRKVEEKLQGFDIKINEINMKAEKLRKSMVSFEEAM